MPDRIRKYALLFPLLAPAAYAQSVDEVFDAMMNAEAANYRLVEDYLVEVQSMGMSRGEYYERVGQVALPNGTTAHVMNMVPIDVIQSRLQDSPMNQMTPGDLRLAAMELQGIGRQMESAMISEMGQTGGDLPGGIGSMMMQGPPPDEHGREQPWLSANPSDMTSMYATMLRGAADRKDELARQDPVGDANDRARDMARVRSMTKIVGRKSVGGRTCINMRADDLDYRQVDDQGNTSVLNRLELCVDEEKYVPLTMTMNATAEVDGKPRDMVIERIEEDYRTPPGCGSMYKPYRTVMRISGALSEEDQKQLAESQKEFAEMKKQLDGMPDAQKRMIMAQMGPQMAMMEKMASGGGIEIESRVQQIECNKGLPSMARLSAVFGLSARGAP